MQVSTHTSSAKTQNAAQHVLERRASGTLASRFAFSHFVTLPPEKIMFDSAGSGGDIFSKTRRRCVGQTDA